MDPSNIDIGAGHEAPLGQDNVPDINQAHYCFSCNAPIKGLFCDACGQKNDNFRRSIFSLLREFASSLTGLESRIWRTWTALLFKPGKVAREYADGARSKWSSPVRAFLAMSIILFGYMSFTGTQLVSIDVHPELKDGVDKPAAELTDEDYTFGGGIYFFEGKKAIAKRNAETDYDLLERKLLGIDRDNINIDISTDGVQTNETDVTDDTEEIQTNELPEAIVEALEVTDEESKAIIDNLMVNGKPVDVDTGLRKFIEIIQDPREVNSVFYSWLPKIMFLMMPFSMFIGAIFIRGRGNALLYDHLVHAAYIHAVVYFLIFVGIIASRLIHGAPIALAIFFGMMIYLPISLKRMFGRGWFKTIWTAYGVGFIYFLTILIIIMALLILGMSQTLGTAG